MAKQLELQKHIKSGVEKAVDNYQSENEDIVLLCFPGDELSMGGCMAAGREFFHINSHGDAKPCPFSPYSDINVKDTSLKGSDTFLPVSETAG